MYKKILADPVVAEKYSLADVDRNPLIFHGMEHVLNTLGLAKKLFAVLDLDAATENAILVALALHDVAKHEAPDAHELPSYEFAKKYLVDARFPYKKEALLAIRNHYYPQDNHDLIGIIVCMCDKLDITAAHLTDVGQASDYYFNGIKNVEFTFANNVFTVNVTCTDDYNLEKFLRHRFRPIVIGCSILHFSRIYDCKPAWIMQGRDMSEFFVEKHFSGYSQNSPTQSESNKK